MTTIRTESARQSDRVAFRMPIEVSWYGSGGVLVKQQAVTLLISRNGGVIRSQLLAQLIKAKPGEQVLDYCSGSGGKTLAFAPQINEFAGRRTIQLKVLDWKPMA